MNERSEQPQPSRNDRRGSSGVPQDVRGVARLLDEAGLDLSRRLGADGVDRIFAASDLQRPLGLAEVTPIASRRDLQPRPRRILGPLGRVPRGTRRLALAAAFSMVVLSAAVLYLAMRPTAESVREDGLGGSMIADGAPDRAPALSPSSGGLPAMGLPVMGLPEHFDEALGGGYAVATRSQPLGEVVVAFAGGGVMRQTPQRPGGEPVFDAASFLDAGGATYDDLSGEMAAILASTGGAIR